MDWDLKQLRADGTLAENPIHECATCALKDRVYVKTPNGKQFAALWRCGVLSQKTKEEVLVQPHENCYDHRSLSDYWEKSDLALVR
jgi:hypothetical protein